MTYNKTNSKTQENKEVLKEEVKEVAESQELKNNSENSSSSVPSTDDLLKIIAGLQEQIASLNNKIVETQIPVQSTLESFQDDTMTRTDKLLEILANRKQDKEVVIIHNREIIGGASTAIKLTGLTINFHKLGEERVVSWQQFEECVSKYRRFFDREIILLGADYQEIAERYSVPCQKRGANHSFTRQELTNIYRLDVHALEEYYNSLTKQDKDFLCSYWLGKCYEKAPGFYDRYKIELLNRLSDSHAFDNLLTLMNNDYKNN